MMIDILNDRRIELTNKSILTSKEKKELDLLVRCVDYYINQSMPGYRLDTVQRLVNQLRQIGQSNGA
jgi:hypothetical protein